MSFSDIPISAVVWCVVLTAAIEAVTCILRFSCRWEATRDTTAVGRLTFGLRIHHAYLGVAAMAIGLLVPAGPALAWLLTTGMALVLSDLIHHFFVLWPVTGDPQFHLAYPAIDREGLPPDSSSLAVAEAAIEGCEEA
jgi:hypothetical protein